MNSLTKCTPGPTFTTFDWPFASVTRTFCSQRETGALVERAVPNSPSSQPARNTVGTYRDRGSRVDVFKLVRRVPPVASSSSVGSSGGSVWLAGIARRTRLHVLNRVARSTRRIAAPSRSQLVPAASVKKFIPSNTLSRALMNCEYAGSTRIPGSRRQQPPNDQTSAMTFRRRTAKAGECVSNVVSKTSCGDDWSRSC